MFEIVRENHESLPQILITEVAAGQKELGLFSNKENSGESPESKFVLELSFNYGKYNFKYDNFSAPSYVSLEKKEDSWIFHKLKKDLLKEKNAILFIKSLGLDLRNGRITKTKSEALSWLQENSDSLKEHQISVKQNTEQYQQNSFEYRDPQDTLNNEFPWQSPENNTPNVLSGKETGWGRVGPHGAGHYVKMVHNGIEYGMMQAFAEGFGILKAKKEFGLDLSQISHIWQNGSVVRSWLLDLAANDLDEDTELKDIKPWVADSGEGRWTVFESIDLDVPAPIITLALQMRFASRDEENYPARMLAALRNQFGGHAIKKAE